ncbi:MAG: hypothetical protein IJW73_01495 [Candidatus Gastranaerophilales bacterium]|nr:hypothetical protein [Candidatus Gastranaerophilales bacterium]
MINNISFLNFKSNLQLAKKNNSSFQKQNITATKLIPLQYDTISFSGSKSLNKSLFDAFDNASICQEVHNNATNAEKSLSSTLQKALESLTYNKDNPKAPIEAITTRVKSPYSIREKIASELEYRITQDNPKAFNPKKAQDIKSTLGDIIGARITLRDNDSAETTKIIDALIEQVEKGTLKIKRIENYEPENLDPKYRYFKHEDLQRLQQAAQKQTRERVVLKNESKKTGYMALHIDVDLSDPVKYSTVRDGYGGEIQIIGADVQKLKEVEDACYKLQQGKAIRAGHQAYDAFSSYFTKYYKSSEKYPNIKEAFTKYTALAYQKQREKEPVEIGQRKKKIPIPLFKNGQIYNPTTEFLTIKEAGMEKELPLELDFNKLADIKYFSDGLFNLTQNN